MGELAQDRGTVGIESIHLGAVVVKRDREGSSGQTRGGDWRVHEIWAVSWTDRFHTGILEARNDFLEFVSSKSRKVQDPGQRANKSPSYQAQDDRIGPLQLVKLESKRKLDLLPFFSCRRGGHDTRSGGGFRIRNAPGEWWEWWGGAFSDFLQGAIGAGVRRNLREGCIRKSDPDWELHPRCFKAAKLNVQGHGLARGPIASESGHNPDRRVIARQTPLARCFLHRHPRKAQNTGSFSTAALLFNGRPAVAFRIS
eukprot:scaffold2771_cov252-Pinguiococcus_pyrenoidosus.AAC.49